MQPLNYLKSCLKIGRLRYWLAVLSCCFVVAIHPVIAIDRPTSLTPVSDFVQSTLSATQLLDQGKQRFEAGQFSEAANFWRQAAQAYQSQGDRLNQALSLNYLSLVYQELGDWQQANQAITSSLDRLKSFPNLDPAGIAILAQAFNTQGKLQLAQGQPDAALTTWQTAERTYTQIKDIPGVLGSQINQGQALQTLGLYRRAKTVLEQVSRQLQEQPSSTLKVTGLRNLGVVLQVMGDLTQSQAVLKDSLAIAQQLNLPAEISATLFSLGNTTRALQDNPSALQFYQQAAATAPTILSRLEAQVNQLSLLLDTKETAAAQTLLQQMEPQLATLPPSRAGIYIQVNWAESAMRNAIRSPQTEPARNAIATQLALATNQAKQLQDARAESFALGQLGALYKQTNQQTEAQNLTKQALLIAQEINASDIAYRWQWQLGRIFKQSGNREGAIAAYTEAVNSLKSLRGDLVAMSPDVQFSFRERVEPVYRELVALLVQPEAPNQTELKQARQVIEALQLAEIENFIRSACLDIRLSQIDTADPKAAVVYPIILADRLTVILSLPGQPLKTYSTLIPSEKVETVLEQALESFNPIFSDPERLRLSGQIYDWLIRPAEAFLSTSPVKTLVFVLDGALRNIPMAALYDGKQYLIEKYGVAITPGLQLLGPQEPLAKERLGVIIGALTEARQGFPALPGVTVESNAIASKLASKVFLNRNFTQEALQAQLQGAASPLVHLATHGRFSSNLSETFILTWDNQLNIEGLRTLLRSGSEGQRPIELLVLSACETAEGDNRAALGLAGLAVRSGARSTLASLWSVNDASTAELMVLFYQSLAQEGLSKAESLRQSQLAILHNSQYQHPFYWAPFILVGNWL